MQASGQFDLMNAPLMLALNAGDCSLDRIRAVTSFLRTPRGRAFRSEIGSWIGQIVSITALVPEVYREWRPLVLDSLEFIFSRLSDVRLATKLVEQSELALDAPVEVRLMRLISRMPGIQKLGQVLARNRHLDPALRKALSGLENGLSDSDPQAILAIIRKQLGTRLKRYDVQVDSELCCEATVSAVVRFTWLNPATRERERGVFKVMKPGVPRQFAEDMTLLQRLSDYLAKDRGHGIGSREIAETVAESRLLLEHELDFRREQKTLYEAFESYRLQSGIRVPCPMLPLSTPQMTAMTEEVGVKVTDAFRDRPARRRRIAEQIVEAMVAVPLLSKDEYSLLHADPHAGNLFYDEKAHELVVLDWALTERLSREYRRHLALLVIMTTLRDSAGVAQQIVALSLSAKSSGPQQRLISTRVRRFLTGFPAGKSPGALAAMSLLDSIAMEGVRFPASLAMFRKVIFTLDGVLHDVAGPDIRLDCDIIREYILRALSSFATDLAPLGVGDFVSIGASAMFYPVRTWIAGRLGELVATPS